jgi:hypothetical protein
MDAYIGRYTHEETSHRNFGYPGRLAQDDGSTIGHPMLNFAPNSAYGTNWDADGNSIIDVFEGGPRAGEDLILANVDSFEIDVWDDGLATPRFVKLGHVNGTPAAHGHYAHTQSLNAGYGPRIVGVGADGSPGIASYNDDQALTGDTSTDNPAELGWPYSDDAWNRVFDTWHPGATTGVASRIRTLNPPPPGQEPYAEVHEPPFRPLRRQLSAGWEWGGDRAVPANVVIFPGHEDRNYNDVLDPSEDTNTNGLLDASEDTYAGAPSANGNGVLDGPEDRNGNGVIDSDLSYCYAQVGLVDSASPANTGLKQPEWPREPGLTVVDGNVIWQCFDNRVGLQMIRITVRYRDPASASPRQVSIIHSFVE